MNDVDRAPSRAASPAPSAAEGDGAQAVADAVRELERELRAQGARRWLNRLLILVVLAVLVGGFYGYRKYTEPPPPARYTSKKIEKRDIVEQVQATGAVKPLNEVEVGAQVSGRIVKVYADYNTQVKKGDLLAEIDPSLFGAQVSQTGAQLTAAKASVERAKSRVESTKTDLGRAKRLAAEGVATQADVDQAQGAYDVARADLAAAKAQITQLGAMLHSARTTLAYTRIYSPIDGLVINRAVDPGQTVASSFSSPVLFVIAQDLKKMQILAEIDEADVGKIREKMDAEVVVDAFHGEKFEGVVTQIRYSPNNNQGVVTYAAVVDVDNPDLKLRPGMTATVTIKTAEAKGVTAVPNAALRFRPAPQKDDEGKPVPQPQPKKLEGDQGRLYALVDETAGAEEIEERVVTVGITDGVWTAVRGDPPEPGTDVVTEEKPSKKRGFRLF